MLVIELLIEHASHTLNRPFSYIYNGEKTVAKGYRVLVTFNNQSLMGYVVNAYRYDKGLEALTNELGFEPSEIDDVIDNSPLLNDELLKLADQISRYYLAPKISVLQAMLPPSLSPRYSSLNAPKIAYDQYLSVIDDDEDELTAKQIELLRFIKSEGKVLKRDVKSVSVVNKLLELKRIEIIKEEQRRLKVPNFVYTVPKELTKDQKSVIDEFNSSDDTTYLLEGVTGSGKSEVYLALSEQILKEGKSVLMLVPEISLTPMMVEYFLRRFEGNVAILHSQLTPAQKYDEYRMIANGNCKVVVGARSAIFAPLKNIGLIILDEEHVESYKQDTLPFYHAKDVAIMRAKNCGAKVLLGSATPSLESRARAQKGVYHFLKLEHRINNQPLPKTSIVNMADFANIDRESYIFSLKLRDAISETLGRNEQVILLINRRGFSSSLTCRQCGHVFKCPTCGIPLTYHKKDNMLKCHHCDYVEVAPDVCPECGSKYLMRTGYGTERIEEEVLRLWPNAKTLRLDSDSAKNRNKIPLIIESFRKKEANVLIGTQMIAKGHDFPDVTLVGIVLADIGLSMPSYRSSERAFQLITQAVGRSGRKDKLGQAIIQTYLPTHYAITMGARQDYEMFYRTEMAMRKQQYYPPYCFIASVIISSKTEDQVVESSYAIADFLRDKVGDKAMILGPSTPYISFEQNRFVRQVMLKYKDGEFVKDILNQMLKSLQRKTQISIQINIDPYNF